MTNGLRRACSAAMVVISYATIASSQESGEKGIHAYDAATEATILGTIDSVEEVSRGGVRGTHVVVKTKDKSIVAMLGPTKYLNAEGFTFRRGDVVEVTGSVARMHGDEVMIAREVLKGGKKLVLRDKTGKPQWPAPAQRRQIPL